ncbi:MAG: lysine biosynthesis protein LysX [Candidatus Baldrarchaeia archaeon]
MIVGLLHNRIGFEEKEIMKELSKRNVKVDIIDCRNLNFDLHDPSSFPHADVFLQRCISYFKGLYVSAILESEGFTVINPYITTKICGDKLFTYLVLKQHNIPIPRTSISFGIEGALSSAEKMGFPVVIKPLVGSWGRLVALATDTFSLKSILESRETLGGPLHKIFYLQEYIKTNRDIRALVVGDEVVAAMYRYVIDGDWRSNAHRGAHAEKAKISDDLQDICLKISEITHGKILGIDLIEMENQQLVVLEINHNPQFRKISSVCSVNVAAKIAEFLVKFRKE